MNCPPTNCLVLTPTTGSTSPQFLLGIRNGEELELEKLSPDILISSLLTFGTAISNLTEDELHPSPMTNELFGGLVHLLIAASSVSLNKPAVLNNPIVQRLRPNVVAQCGKAEYYLESSFASQVMRGKRKVEEFTYHENYKLLIDFEVKSLAEYSAGVRHGDVKEIAIIGSGPLPLTSILLREKFPSAKIINYDHNEEAVGLGEGVISSYSSHTTTPPDARAPQSAKMNDGRIESVNCTALEIRKLEDADLVWLAALVEEKGRIVRHLHGIMKKGGILVSRSANGLKRFLYDKVERGMYEDAGWEDFQEFIPENKQVINSIVVGRKR